MAGAEQAKLTVCFCASALNRCCARHGHGVCGMCWLVEHHHTGASFVPGHGYGTAGDGTWLELWNYGINCNITSHDAQLQFCNMWACSSVGKSKPCNRDTPPPPPSGGLHFSGHVINEISSHIRIRRGWAMDEAAACRVGYRTSPPSASRDLYHPALATATAPLLPTDATPIVSYTAQVPPCTQAGRSLAVGPCKAKNLMI